MVCRLIPLHKSAHAAYAALVGFTVVMTSAQTGYAEAVAWSKREAPKASTAPPRKATPEVQPWWHPAALVSYAFAYAYLLFLFVGLLGCPRGWGFFNRHYGDFCTGADMCYGAEFNEPTRNGRSR